MTTFSDRLFLFERRIQMRLAAKNDEARLFCETAHRIRTEAEKLRRSADSLSPASKELIAQIAAVDQTLAEARETLQQNDELRVLLRIELQALVDALAAVRHGCKLCDEGTLLRRSQSAVRLESFS